MTMCKIRNSMSLMMCLALFGCNDASHVSKVNADIQDMKKQAITSQKKSNYFDIKMPKAIQYKDNSITNVNMNEFQVKKAKKKISPIQQYALNEYEYVGTLSDQGSLFAYLLAPDGGLYKISVGEQVSVSHAKVIKITEEQIQLLEKGKDAKSGVIKTIHLKGSQDENNE